MDHPKSHIRIDKKGGKHIHLRLPPFYAQSVIRFGVMLRSPMRITSSAHGGPMESAHGGMGYFTMRSDCEALTRTLPLATFMPLAGVAAAALAAEATG